MTIIPREKIGVIGLGLMGKPIARNLLTAGHPLTVFDHSRAAMEALAGDGADLAASPQDLARRSEIVVTVLPNSPDVEDVMSRPDGVFAGSRPGQLWIDMSTISPLVSQQLAEQAEGFEVQALDAPMSGGDVGAINGTLSIMVGGEAEVLERARPVLSVLGSTITHCGEHGAGQVVKACNQIVVAGVIEVISEALVLGSKAGVNPETIVRVLSGGLAQSRFMDVRGQRMARRDFEPGGRARFHKKDLGIALEVAHNWGVALPVTSLIDQMFTTVIENGNGDQDHSVLLTVLEQMGNHIVGSEPM